jgi:hypothetical protein
MSHCMNVCTLSGAVERCGCCCQRERRSDVEGWCLSCGCLCDGEMKCSTQIKAQCQGITATVSNVGTASATAATTVAAAAAQMQIVRGRRGDLTFATVSILSSLIVSRWTADEQAHTNELRQTSNVSWVGEPSLSEARNSQQWATLRQQ